MESSLAFLLGVFVASTKGLAIASVIFGIAWWRARARLRKLEAERPEPGELERRLEQLETSLEYLSATLERLAAGQDELRRLRPGPADRIPEAPSAKRAES